MGITLHEQRNREARGFDGVCRISADESKSLRARRPDRRRADDGVRGVAHFEPRSLLAHRPWRGQNGERKKRVMSQSLPEIHLIRHGETAWTISRQHTGLTDIPLTERGEHQARRFGEHLRGRTFAHVFTSPLQRARRTSELAGFGATAQIDPDLVEWDYGDYESLTTSQILKRRPGWHLFRDGCPGGESVAQVGARADRVIGRLRALEGDVLCSPAATSCACSRRGGLASTRRAAAFSCSARPRSASSGTNTTKVIR